MASKLLSKMKKRRARERLLCLPVPRDDAARSPPYGYRGNDVDRVIPTIIDDTARGKSSSSGLPLPRSSSSSSSTSSTSASTMSSAPQASSSSSLSSTSSSSPSSFTSGYHSSSSPNSSSEERRLSVDHDKVFQVWEQLGNKRQTPTCSTPLHHCDCTADQTARQRRHHRRTRSSKRTEDSTSSLLSIRRTLREDRSNLRYLPSSDSASVSYVRSKFLSKTLAETSEPATHVLDKDLHRTGGEQTKPSSYLGSESTRRSSAAIRNAAQDTPSRLRAAKERRRPSLSARRSLLGTTVRGESRPRASSEFCSRKSSMSAQRLKDRSRKQRQGDTNSVARDDSGVWERSRGVPVDESMSEFLSNANMDNLVAFLTFYDKVTSDSSKSTCKYAAAALSETESLV